MDRDVDQVLMNINKTAGGIVSAALFSTAMTFKLATFLMRMAKKGLAASGLVDAFKNFNTKTSGEFTVYNIPLSKEKAQMVNELNKLNLNLEKEKNPFKAAKMRNDIKNIEKQLPELQHLKTLGIEHCMLPKLNGSMQTIQVAIARPDEQKFKNWYLNHLSTEMNGGKKNLEAIKVFTEGNYTILNMPFEDKKELNDMFKDFKRMGVNYAKCPDLNVGDGYTQVAVPNSERSLVEDWFKLWKNKQLSNGEEVTKEMYAMDGNSYMETGSMSDDAYINSAEQIYQDANKEFEQQSNPVPWTQKMQHENSPEYVKLLQDNNYEKITINKETLVDKLNTENMKHIMESAKRNGMFVSRVPGTYGHHQEALVLPIDKVFTTDDDKTFVAFLHKGQDHMVVNSEGVIQKKNFELTYKPYDVVTRNLNRVNNMTKDKALEKGMQVAKDIAAAVPVPGMPLKP